MAEAIDQVEKGLLRKLKPLTRTDSMDLIDTPVTTEVGLNPTDKLRAFGGLRKSRTMEACRSIPPIKLA